MMGLLQAHQNYQPMEGKTFRAYAEFRIRGAILDEMRRIDPMSQPMRRKVRKFENTINMMAHSSVDSPVRKSSLTSSKYQSGMSKTCGETSNKFGSSIQTTAM